ncbi:AMP-binding protein [Aequoribacter fuscus]|uniref:AMP-binding protein n=1 Tax=Aequoribacter fuscus TaxID=2518989 RepID=UPI00130150E8|nr:AMP-binding protein [Aequoribacter fuscus]
MISDDDSLSFERFNILVTTFAESFSHFKKRSIFLIVMDNSINCVATYIACLKLKIIPLLLPENIMEEDLKKYIELYNPSAIFSKNRILELNHQRVVPNQEVALLLSTSGSTGSPKLVALSYEALQSNADSISVYLNLTCNDRGFCSMPLSYSYGLSILNSHLNCNASVVITKKTPFDKDFIDMFQANNCTNISGVPFLHEALLRTGFYKNKYPSLRFITQAGGNLKERFKKKILEYAETYNKEFFVMYGQTEATARISYVPPNMLMDKLLSIGIAIPGGKLRLSSESEIIYSGPNVMMGYIEKFSDFAALTGLSELRTGDLGYVDKDGFFFITGRAKRYIKIAGFRYSLDEIEMRLSDLFHDDFMVDGEEDLLNVFSIKSYEFQKLAICIQKNFKINGNYIKFYVIDSFPLNDNGKKDYKALKK